MLVSNMSHDVSIEAPRNMSNGDRSSGMNVIVPMGGIGERFASHGYSVPKPLINIAGTPMLFWLLANLKFCSNDTLFIAIHQWIENKHKLRDRLRAHFPALNIVFLGLKFQTRGAAETLHVVTNSMTEAQLSRRTLCLDCDTFYLSDILSAFRSLADGVGCCCFFRDPDSTNLYSYITLKGSLWNEEHSASNFASMFPVITGIAEKKAISSYANTGAYGFESARSLRQHLGIVLNHDAPRRGEFYTSSIIDRMLSEGYTFQGIPTSNFHCVGTVPQLHSFLLRLKGDLRHLGPRQCFCFDLFGVLLQKHALRAKVQGCHMLLPVTKNIQLLHELCRFGHRVLLYCEGSCLSSPEASENWERTMRNVVESLGFSRTCIHFGKPSADIYISRNAVNDLLDLEKGIGWTLSESNTGDPASGLGHWEVLNSSRSIGNVEELLMAGLLTSWRIQLLLKCVLRWCRNESLHTDVSSSAESGSIMKGVLQSFVFLTSNRVVCSKHEFYCSGGLHQTLNCILVRLNELSKEGDAQSSVVQGSISDLRRNTAALLQYG